MLWAPYLLCSSGDTSELSFLPSEPKKEGNEGCWPFLWELCPAWLGEVPCSPFPSYLLLLILPPRNILRTSPVTLIMSLWVGEMAVHSCLDLREARSMGKAGRCQEPDPLWAVVGLPSAAVLQSLAGGVWGTQTRGICIFVPVPLEMLLPQAGQPSSSRLHSCCSDYISIKKSSYHAGRLLYSSSGELALP